MAQLPTNVAESPLSLLLAAAGLVRTHQGKVRDTWALPGFSGYQLVVATDRISAFDFVLNLLVPQKGPVLVALTVFWLTTVLRQFANHLVAYGAAVDAYLPAVLCRNFELQCRALVVRRLEMLPIECIPRGYLAGSALAAYRTNNGVVCGIQFPEGLHDGSKLPQPVFTVTTKAVEGHDEHLDVQSVVAKYGQQVSDLTVALYTAGADYALTRDIIIADTKFEYGEDYSNHDHGTLVLGDEVLTPDSSRFWALEDYKSAQQKQKSPSGWDKQPVRDAMSQVETPFGVKANKLDPENPEHAAWVHSELSLPDEVVAATSPRYTECFWMLVGKDLQTFQAEDMGVSA